MRQVTGVKKYFFLSKLLLNPGMWKLPLRFLTIMARMVSSEKGTLLDDKIYINMHLAPIPSESFNTAIKNFLRVKNGETVPFSVYISLTDRCVMNCEYCSNRKIKKSSGLKKETIIALIKDIQDAGPSCIGFTGGEPLLREDLEEIISSVEKKSYTILFTSGHGLNEKRAEKLKTSGLTIASVSLDSPDEKTNNVIRGSAAFSSAVNAVKFFSDAGIYTVVTAVLSKDTFPDKMRLVKFCGGIGAHEVRFMERVPSGKSSSEKEKHLRASDMVELENFRRKINKDPSLPKVTLLSRFESKEYFGCGAGRYHLYVDAAGNVCPCDFVQAPEGNILKEKFSSIYKRLSETAHESPFCMKKTLLKNPDHAMNETQNNTELSGIFKAFRK